MKKRILMCSESSDIASGFGNYTKNILQRLYNTNKYEIAELSCFRDASTPKTEPWTIYPVAVKSNHPLYNDYISNDMNQFGQWRFDLALIDFKPNIVFDVRDFWNFTYQSTSHFRNFYSWVIAPTYDSAPQKIDVINTFATADVLSFHTEWAKNNLINKFNYANTNIGPVVSDAIDHNVFKPVEYSKKHHKNKYKISEDCFIIGSVMRNQKRKLLPDIIEVFKNLTAKHSTKNIILYLHTSYPDGLGWDLPGLLLEHNVYDKVLITYNCNKCGNFFPSVFKGTNTICQSCGNAYAGIASIRNNINEQQLRDLYNLFDVYVQYSICEGFGIPPIEAAACGVPVITIDHEAMGEVGKNIEADMVPIIRTFREQETNADRHYPDNNILFAYLEKYINMDIDTLNKIGKKSRKKALMTYNWDKTAKVFEEIFDNIDINTKLSWDSPKREVDTEFPINNTDNNHRYIIYQIIDNVIKEPQLKYTNFIQELIKSADDGFIQAGQRVSTFGPKQYINILETYMNGKASYENIRISKTPYLHMSAQLKDFFEYSKK